MKKIFLLFFTTLLAALSFSCDDQVNPKTDFKEIYALNCVIRGDTSYQVATITRSYNVDGFDPLTNRSDPFVSGGKVKLIYLNGTVTYNFRDTTIVRPTDSRYKTPMHFYYLKNFQPTSESPIIIEATLPNGKVLKAKAISFYVSPYLIGEFHYTIPSAVFGKYLNFSWSEMQTQTKDESVYYVPELVVLYSKVENGNRVKYQKKIPMYYIPGTGGEIPLYPSVQANITSINFDTLSVRKAMQEISDGDANKQNYIVDKAIFRLLVADKNLAVYYAAQKTFLDEFSVRVTQPEFSNVNGGLGIFGTLNSAQVDVEISPKYIRSFGYLPF